MNFEAEFVEKAASRDLEIGVIGLGYVGLPIVMAFHAAGFRVVGIDVDPAKIEDLQRGSSYIRHISDDSIAGLHQSDRFAAGTDFAALARCDAILICVPTPLGKHREPDLSYVEKTCQAISEMLVPNQIIVLESTTYPGTSNEIMVPILEAGSGLKVDVDFYIGYSPEREDPGSQDFETSTIPKVIGADNPVALSMMDAFYGAIVGELVPVSSMRTAEAVKLLENIYRCVNIALVNEMKMVFEKMDIDVWEVIKAASTKPFGFMPFYPGPGLGGHCIPIDPFYLTWKALEYGQSTQFIELAGVVNNNMPAYVIERLVAALSLHRKKAMNGAKVLLIGMAYKKNIGDMRESPSLVLLEQMENHGALVDYYDPHVPEITQNRAHPALISRKSVAWDVEAFADYDVALISTDHDVIDWQELVAAVPLVVDTRNATAGLTPSLLEKVVRA